MFTPEKSTPASSPAASDLPTSKAAKPQRVLACVLCQQRKVKCERKFPCSNCIKSGAKCVPASTLGPRQRRRRFPERELLDRLRHYEDLLRENNIQFESLHKGPTITGKQLANTHNESHSYRSLGDEQLVDAEGADRPTSPAKAIKSETGYGVKNFWRAINQRDPSHSPEDNSSDSSPDDFNESTLKKAWNEFRPSSDHLLFGGHEAAIDLYTLHPEQVQIFRLWQIYIDKVNPLLSVIHTPTMQGRILNAASNLAGISSTLAALMFSIYCISILSLSEDECRTMFGVPREDLLPKYQFGCQQALLSCGFLRSSDRDCLTALYLYLISVRTSIDPGSLNSMLGVAMRIAQRMGLHNESTHAEYPVFESEMRRRLWWSLVLFDTRMCEMSVYTTSILLPTWDCRIPLNINDFDLQPEMKDMPVSHEKPTEALFAVVRSEMGDIVRHSAFHLDFVSPALKAITRNPQRSQVSESGDLVAVQKIIEDKYLKFCNPENPLHFFTIWLMRGQLAKSRLYEHYSRFPGSSVQPTDAQRDAAIPHAQDMLECDTKLSASPIIKGYKWFLDMYFPFPAYNHLLQDLKRRPVSNHAQRSWELMSDNYEARSMLPVEDDNPFLKIFIKMLLQAWEACEAGLKQSGAPLDLPRIVSSIGQKVAQEKQGSQDIGKGDSNDVFSMDIDFSMSMPLDSHSYNRLQGMGRAQAFPGSGMRPYYNAPRQATANVNLNDLNLDSMNWNLLHGFGW